MLEVFRIEKGCWGMTLPLDILRSSTELCDTLVRLRLRYGDFMGAWAVSSEFKLFLENKGDSQVRDMLSCAVLNIAWRAFSKIDESSSSNIFKRCF